MGYMTRRPELHAHPRSLVTYALSLITLAVDYYAESPAFEHEHRYGRVARYAWGRDYHDVVKPRLQALVSKIEHIATRPIHARCFVDAVPLLERAVASRAGIGFFGKNTNLLQPRGGSWFFLSEILLDLELPADNHEIKISCGTCHRCIDACPTNAFAGPYRLDSRRCISYLTIENNGAIPRELRMGLGDWIFGCDVCQDVCPFNKGKWTGGEDFPGLEALAPLMRPESIMEMSYDEIGRTLAPKYWYIKPENLWKWKLNALTVMMNGYSEKYEAPIKLGLEDPNETVRDFTRGICSKLGISF